MSKRWMLGMLAVAGVVAWGATSASAAQLDPPKEPGGEYLLQLDYNDTPYDPNHIMMGGDPNDPNTTRALGHGSFTVLFIPGGSLVAVSRLSGTMSLFLDDPTPGTPRNWDGKCVLGKAYEFFNLDNISYFLWPGTIEAHIYAGDLRFFDMDVWYQDIDWVIPQIDPNWWPDPNDGMKFLDPNWYPDPNKGGDPNDPNYPVNEDDEPNDPNYNRWADLTGGPPISSGILNSEILFFWAFTIQNGPPEDPNSWDIDADIQWSAPFGPWTVTVADANQLYDPPPVGGDVQVMAEWAYHIISDDFPAKGLVHLEGAAYIPPTPWTLTLKKKDCTSFAVDPCLPAYQDGRLVVCSAVVPTGNKVFNKWTVQGPNGKDDPCYHVRKETDPVLYHVMDGNYVIKATCKCGGGGLEPFAAVVLLVLGLGVLIRRLA